MQTHHYHANPSQPDNPLSVISLCSGIGGDIAALEQAGIRHEILAVAEIDPVASAFLARKFPHIPNLGDVTAVTDWNQFHARTIDLLTAGIPCQPFSTAGKRRGMADARDLTGTICAIINEVHPAAVLIENVPTYQSAEGGKAFRTLLESLHRRGYAVSWRVIDAALYLPQRRRRLWILGHRRVDEAGVAEVLRLAASGAVLAAPSREIRIPTAGSTSGGALVRHPPRLGTLTASGSGLSRAGMKRSEMDFLVVQENDNGGLVVRRPTPLEAMRAQGFPDGWVGEVRYKGRPLSDTALYSLAGNAWPVPVARAILWHLYHGAMVNARAA